VHAYLQIRERTAEFRRDQDIDPFVLQRITAAGVVMVRDGQDIAFPGVQGGDEGSGGEPRFGQSQHPSKEFFRPVAVEVVAMEIDPEAFAGREFQLLPLKEFLHPHAKRVPE
jgi:hypothetical protein